MDNRVIIHGWMKLFAANFGVILADRFSFTHFSMNLSVGFVFHGWSIESIKLRLHSE
jgi:hypothetical protein